MFIVDSHCHLDYPGLCERMDDVLKNADDLGVKMMVTISTEVKDFHKLKAIVEEHDHIYCTIGTHPNHAADEPDTSAEELIEIAQHPKVVGIGEAGLDYHYDYATPEQQEYGFRQHIAAARETGLPLVIHSRDAEEDTIKILEEEMAKGEFKPLLHCYSSKPILAERGIELGAYVSFSGILTFNSAKEIQQVAKDTQIDRILVETDAPYLAPAPHRGKKNEPGFTRHTLEKLADLKGLSVEEAAMKTSENFFRLFSKVPVPEAFKKELAA